ncbi:MAG TPA: ABC transporter ATP-binding protein [Lachnoclostridium sp.]|jgi:ABC-2 type transport system ATP-binding protein|uniref:ABC transporter ATP-binding protein n=1 Tax=Lacrimispora sp. TaxID=2719234 RepID=UPI000EECDC4D|nr:ABC transporter ATP-binding protein [Lacrimispora sp.]HCD45528.1 ABC transporter ATP-binding protein [Lachnoclostridium sp.]
MLNVENLTKQYKTFTAVDKVSFTVKQGVIFGFLGHNGAGKTTTLSMLTTLLLPTSGRATIDGLDIQKDNLKVRNLIGYLPENVRLYGELTARQNLRFFGELSGVSNVDKNINEVLELLNFTEWADQKVKTLSKGMRQRVGIAQAILHKPKLLFLDEPTSGLDPQGTLDIRNILLKVNAEWGATIFMNTHLLSEVTKVCTDIGIISHGKLLISDTLQNLEQKFSDCKSLEEIYFRIESGGGVH